MSRRVLRHVDEDVWREVGPRLHQDDVPPVAGLKHRAVVDTAWAVAERDAAHRLVAGVGVYEGAKYGMPVRKRQGRIGLLAAQRDCCGNAK